MVPYVRKSFYKHYKDGLKYIEEMVDYQIESEFPINFDPTTKPIGDNVFWRMPKAFEYAHKMTEKEVHQAVEGLYHNLRLQLYSFHETKLTASGSLKGFSLFQNAKLIQRKCQSDSPVGSITTEPKNERTTGDCHRLSGFIYDR